jgi:hypothetical protein
MKEKIFMILVQVHHDHLRTFFSEIKKHWIGEGREGEGGGGRGKEGEGGGRRGREGWE